MNKSIIILVIIGLLALALYSRYPIFSWHQKMTVEVETPEGLVSGSAVVKAGIDYTTGIGNLSGGGASKFHRGEATIVELPNERYLFILLGDPTSNAQSSFKARLLGDTDAKDFRWKKNFSKLKKLRERVPLVTQSYNYPLFVTFTDINDPTTVQQVDPQDLAATFGDGYALKSITLEITDEPVTWGRVEKLLGWIYTAESMTPRESRPRLAKDLTFAQKIHLYDFIDIKSWAKERAERGIPGTVYH